MDSRRMDEDLGGKEKEEEHSKRLETDLETTRNKKATEGDEEGVEGAKSSRRMENEEEKSSTREQFSPAGRTRRQKFGICEEKC